MGSGLLKRTMLWCLLIILLFGLVLKSQSLSLPLFTFGEAFQSANARIVVANFTGRGGNELITQVFYDSASYPRNVAFRAMAVRDNTLEQRWISIPVEATNVFGVGDIRNNGQTLILFVRQGDGPTSHLMTIDKSGVIQELFSVQGDVNRIDVGDVDRDGANEIILSRVLHQYHEAIDGEIDIYRWQGQSASQIGTLKPDSGNGIAGFMDFRLLDLTDGRRELVLEEQTSRLGARLRVVVWDQAQKQFVPSRQEQLSRLLNDVGTTNVLQVTQGSQTFVLVGKDQLYKYSLQDRSIVRTLNLAGPYLTEGDIYGDSAKEIIVSTPEERRGERTLYTVHLFKPGEL
jgi:hypothetical protein